MNREGVDILVETARMWADLGFWRENGGGGTTFHVHGVTGPDEYTTVVNDNLFTNVMARFNLRQGGRGGAAAGAATCRWRTGGWSSGWRSTRTRSTSGRACADAHGHPVRRGDRDQPAGLALPGPRGLGPGNTPAEKRPLLLHYHPLVIYRFQVLKQADVVLALFLQGDHFSFEQKRADFEYYDPITTGDSTLSGVVQSIIAAEVGYRDLALRYFHNALFVDLADLHGNTTDGVHVASTGGVWNCLAYGFGGMRDYNGVVTFDPRLPESWARTDLPGHAAGHPGPGRPDRGRRSPSPCWTGSGPRCRSAGTGSRCRAESPVRIPLADQGPRIDTAAAGGQRRPAARRHPDHRLGAPARPISPRQSPAERWPTSRSWRAPVRAWSRSPSSASGSLR